MKLRDATDDDLEEILRLNNEAVPGVNKLTFDKLKNIFDKSSYKRVIETSQIDGFLLGLDAYSDYEGQNYKIHKIYNTRTNWMYVDRIVIGTHAKQKGLGGKFYEDFKLYALNTYYSHYILCEVYGDNTHSLNFHWKHGFEVYHTVEDTLMLRCQLREL